MNEKVNQRANEAGADDVRWDLSDLYEGLTDPALDEDLGRFVELAERFSKRHKGNLKSTLGQSLDDQAVLRQLSDKLLVYLSLRRSTDATNADLRGSSLALPRS
jgi:oligoendopeptidase F